VSQKRRLEPARGRIPDRRVRGMTERRSVRPGSRQGARIAARRFHIVGNVAPNDAPERRAVGPVSTSGRSGALPPRVIPGGFGRRGQAAKPDRYRHMSAAHQAAAFVRDLQIPDGTADIARSNRRASGERPSLAHRASCTESARHSQWLRADGFSRLGAVAVALFVAGVIAALWVGVERHPLASATDLASFRTPAQLGAAVRRRVKDVSVASTRTITSEVAS
jgi:hypothetical protein